MNDDFAELLWDNGPVVMMQGQSNRPRSFQNAIPHFGSRIQEKGSNNHTTITTPFQKIGHFKMSTEPKQSNFLHSGSSSCIAANAPDEDVDDDNDVDVDDLLPWINYPIDDNCVSEFLNGYTGNMNSAHYQSNISLHNIRDLKSTPNTHQVVILAEPCKAGCDDGDVSRNNNNNNNNTCKRSPERTQNSSFEASVTLGSSHETEKGNGVILASSSMCLGSSAATPSSEKRKCLGREESGYPSDDPEDESVNLKKPGTDAQYKSKRRSRAAEVHNQSERRRRDRINEKMRALQELIPNCNKTDKASMLDEAIEYLKFLQMQLQVMSMGSGICMAPMMMQHLRNRGMAHFSATGMGLGYRMGNVYDQTMNRSLASSFVPVPQILMQGPQFSSPSSIPAGSPGALHRVPVPMLYQQPPCSLPDIKTNTAAATNSYAKHHQNTLEKLQRSDADHDLHIQSAQAVKGSFRNSSIEQFE